MWSLRIMELRWSLIYLVIICCSFSYITSSPDKNGIHLTNSLLTRMRTYSHENDTNYDFEMLSMQKWKNAERLIHKMAVKAVRQMFTHMADEEVGNVSRKCLSDAIYFLRSLSTMKFWAYKMLDSSSRLPVGILSGSLSDLGDYEGCLNIDVKNRFHGKYCNTKISPFAVQPSLNIPELNITKFFNLVNHKHETLLNTFLSEIHPLYSYFTFRFSLCVPSSCKNEDVEYFVNKVSNQIGLKWEATVMNCNEKSEKDVPFNGFEIFALTIISVVLVIAVIGTLIDIVMNYREDIASCQWRSAKLVKFFLCFSFVTNTKRLLKEDRNPESIKIFHGMKAFTILWVIINHSYNALQPEYLSGSLNIKNIVSSLTFQVILNGYPSVDTFFFITGVILVYARMRSKITTLSIPMYIFKRAWRLGPAVFFLTVGFFLIPRLGDGPLWKEKVLFTEVACWKYWWANLIYVNNFLATENQCMVWLWYVAADMQLYILALIVIIPIRMRPRLGLWMLGGCSLVSVGAIIFNQLYNDLPPAVVLTAILKPLNILKSTELGYYPFYPHAIVTCIGMLTGYLLYKFPKIKVPLSLNIMGWITSILFGLCSVYGVHKWNNEQSATTLESVVYAVGSKLGWSLALAWVTVVCCSGNGGIITKFLSWNGFVLLSRLTYSTYLIHMWILMWFYYNAQRPVEAQHRVLALMYIGFVVLSFITAFVFTQLFESPFMNLERLIFSSATQKTVSQEKIRPEDALEENKVNGNKECNGNGTHITDISKMKIEYKSEIINSSSL